MSFRFRPQYSTRALIRCAGVRVGAALLAFCAAVFAPLHNVSAHDPSQHGFALVMFDPPFPAPGFSLPDLNGKPRTLESYRGQYVLLNFWATWCPPCLEEMPSMEKLQQKFSAHPFTIVAASSDEAGATAVQPFVDKLGVTFPILLDTNKEVAKVYGAQDLPLSFLIDPNGQVIAAAKGARDWASKQAVEVIGELVAK